MSSIKLDTYGSPAQMKSRLHHLLELADSETVTLDSIEFRWSGPEVGWLDLDVLRNGEIAFQTSISWVYKPFCELIPWLLQLAKTYHPSSILDFDIERFQMQICCDYLGSKKKGKHHEDVALFTLALDWNDSLNPAYFVLPVNDFIEKLYYSLRDYFMTHKAVFMQEWQDHEYDDHCLSLIETELTSKELERLIPRSGKAPAIPPHTRDIPVTEKDAFARLDAITDPNQENPVAIDKLYRWICDNWVYSFFGEEKKIKDMRAACFKMMSGGETDYDYQWCFSDAEQVVYPFLGRYNAHRRK